MLGDIVALMIIAAIVAVAIAKIIIDKRNGAQCSGCASCCSRCSYSSQLFSDSIARDRS